MKNSSRGLTELEAKIQIGSELGLTLEEIEKMSFQDLNEMKLNSKEQNEEVSPEVSEQVAISEQDVMIALHENGHNLAAVQNDLNI